MIIRKIHAFYAETDYKLRLSYINPQKYVAVRVKIRLRETVEEPEKHSLWWVQTFSEIQNKVLDLIQSQKLKKEKLLMELFKSNPVPTWKLQGETWTILNG